MKVTDEQIIEACNNNVWMKQAAVDLNIHFNTLKARATKLGVWKPGPGKTTHLRKYGGRNKIPLKDILEGNRPTYPTNNLRKRLIAEGLKQHKCECCGIENWNGISISLELDHINGQRYDHRLENLRILCPNCHSQTDTYKSKNR